MGFVSKSCVTGSNPGKKLTFECNYGELFDLPHYAKNGISSKKQDFQLDQFSKTQLLETNPAKFGSKIKFQNVFCLGLDSKKSTH